MNGIIPLVSYFAPKLLLLFLLMENNKKIYSDKILFIGLMF